MKNRRQLILFNYIFFLLCHHIASAQLPSGCATIDFRTNGNGQANLCPNVNGTAYASNFTGTTYATVPAGAKTGDIKFRYANSTTSLTPPAISKVYQTVSNTTTQLNIHVGPASVPAVSGNDVIVTYCFYTTNLPTSGVLSFELSNPQTGSKLRVCSYDASCNGSCATVSNPAVLLPVSLASFTAREMNQSVILQWATHQESGSKGFEVERSNDGSAFTTIGFVPSKAVNGNSNLKLNYSFRDEQAKAGLNYYRLKQIDLDGMFKVSEVKQLVAKRSFFNLQLKEKGFVVTENSNDLFTVLVCNYAGHILQTIHGKTQINVNGLQPGHYIAKIYNGQQNSVEKIRIR